MLQTAQTVEHPSVEQLRRLSPLDTLAPETLAALTRQAPCLQASPGTPLLKIGETEPNILYLLHGEVELRAQDGAVQRIRHDQPSAQVPIARLRPSRYEVVARTPVTYLLIPEPLLQQAPAQAPNGGLDLYEVVEEDGEAQDEAGDQLIYRLYEDLNSNQLLLPSLPEVAIRVGQAVNHELADAKRVAKVIENDPVITAKLIRVANSARYAGKATIASLPEAVARIGLSTTHRLVITFALRELFRTQSPRLKALMHRLWDDARHVAAIGHVLARHYQSLDPETALIAGLVHNIGEVAALSYAREFASLTGDPQALLQAVSAAGPALSPRILEKWDFPDMLVKAVQNLAVDEDAETDCDYGDLLIVARYQYQRRHDPDAPAPAAYTRICTPDDDPEQIAEFLNEAEQELQEMLSLLGD